MYQITVKAYDGSIPVQTGSWSPEAGESVRDMEQIANVNHFFTLLGKMFFTP